MSPPSLRRHARISLAVLAAALAAACSGTVPADDDTSDDALSATCSLRVTKNLFVNSKAPGRLTIANSGQSSASGLTVAFDVPAGAHCTNTQLSDGATLSPLTGSGSTAKTPSNHCVLTLANTTLSAGASLDLRYASDSSTDAPAANIVLSAATCGNAPGGADAGKDSTPPTTPDAGSGGGTTLKTNVSPGGNFDLSHWQLQLPIGSTNAPKIISGSALAGADGYSSIYFFTDKTDGAMTFMDPTTGVTTNGSKHPRSELREVTDGWPTSGTNTETVTVSVPRVPTTVTIGQIFQAAPAPSKPLLELEYSKGGKLRLLLEDTNQGGSATFHDVGQVTDGATFTYVLSLTGKTITVKVNGTTSTFALPPTFVGESFYFKCGNYDQTAVAGTPGTTPGTLVKIYDLKIVHK